MSIRTTLRTTQDIIVSLIEPGSSVLDLGCGDGALLKRLIDEKAVSGRGIDRKERCIAICISRGLSVLQGNLDDGLEDYLSSAYDYVILNRTMQEVRRPDRLLGEMVQFGRRVIVTLPNFGYILNRLQLLHGRMPVNRHIPYQWYDTPKYSLLHPPRLRAAVPSAGNSGPARDGLSSRTSTTACGTQSHRN